MAKLQWKRLRLLSKSKFDLLVSAKVRELIEYYQVSSMFIFKREFDTWLKSVPKRNAYSLDNAYGLKITEGKGEIWKNFAGSDKDPVLVYEIWEEVENG